MAMPELINCIDVTNTKGNKEHLATVKITITLTDSTSGESVTIVGLGSGQDAGDKAVMKAQTAAIKYAYLLSLNISTGDDPEADLQTDQNFSNENQSTHYSNPAQTPYKAPFPVGEQASCADSAKADMVSHSACIASKSGRRQHKNVLESIQMYSIYQQLPKLIFNIICVIKGQ